MGYMRCVVSVQLSRQVVRCVKNTFATSWTSIVTKQPVQTTPLLAACVSLSNSSMNLSCDGRFASPTRASAQTFSCMHLEPPVGAHTHGTFPAGACSHHPWLGRPLAFSGRHFAEREPRPRPGLGFQDSGALLLPVQTKVSANNIHLSVRVMLHHAEHRNDPPCTCGWQQGYVNTVHHTKQAGLYLMQSPSRLFGVVVCHLHQGIVYVHAPHDACHQIHLLDTLTHIPHSCKHLALHPRHGILCSIRGFHWHV